MEEKVLRKQEIFPNTEVLEEAFGSSFPVYQQWMNTITDFPLQLQVEWRFYNDGKAWLCKIIHKKKTLCWLSVWDGFFKVSFFFTEKHVPAIQSLPIEKSLKDSFQDAKTIGKLKPFVITLNDATYFNDLMKILRLKISLK